jgi:hypothetical protein
MNHFLLLPLMIFMSYALTACVSPYQAFNHSERKPIGFKSVKLTHDKEHIGERHLLTYYGDGDKAQNFIDWQQRANELCANGYKVIQHEKNVFYGSIRSPVNGMMVTLGTQQPIDRGVIQCTASRAMKVEK